MSDHDIGIVGLGVMGANLAVNIASHGFSVIGLDREVDKVDNFKQAGNEQLSGIESMSATTRINEFVCSLRSPRTILLLLPAGKAVDTVIDELLPYLKREDIVIDGGNSHFTDTDRRATQLAKKCIHYMGLGISGGAQGARLGPSLMPGGSKAAWEHVQPMFEAIAAKIGDEPCVAWLGRNSAGHYVKMIHNGIEYGLMQLIAESFDLMKRGLKLSPQEIHSIFNDWAYGETGGYLLEITADILLVQDPLDDGYLLDKIQDTARQKGTGMWTSQEAMTLQVATPVIDVAVTMRALSDDKSQREKASQLLQGPHPIEDPPPREDFIHNLGEALFGAMLMTYAQGMHILTQGSQRHGYKLHLQDVTRIWRGGCIIRAPLLEDLHALYARDPALQNPIFDEKLAGRLSQAEDSLRQVVQTAAAWGVPAPAFMAALGYYDAYRSAMLPANLIQAQRDYFGAHGFERNDRDGSFHVQWKRS